jgi:predicted DNA-binding mobile mystery protein A
MHPEFRELRIKQLQRSLDPFMAAKDVTRPRLGWLRAIREVSGVTVRQLAFRLGKGRTLVNKLEKSEADYRITLASLREAADALDCQLVYVLVPKRGSVQDLAERSARTEAEENVRSVEHSMALEDQAVGNVKEKIEEETQRLLKRRKK